MTDTTVVDIKGRAAIPGNNGFDPTLVTGLVGRIERLFEELASERGYYMGKAREIRDSISLVYDEAKERGVPRRELRAVLRTRELVRKFTAIRDELEPEQRETYDQIRHALGDLADLPLGASVLEHAPKSEHGEALDSLMGG